MPSGSLKTPSQRQLRVGEELRHILAHVFERGMLNDPALRAQAEDKQLEVQVGGVNPHVHL